MNTMAARKLLVMCAPAPVFPVPRAGMDASRDTRFIIRNAGYKDVECVFKVRIPCAQQQTGQTPEGAAAPVDQLEKDHSLGPQTTASDDAHLDSSVGNSDSDDSFVCVAQQLTDTCTATTLSTPPNSTVHNADTQGQGRPTTSSAGTGKLVLSYG
jgi:hypothetical protein